MRAAGTGYASRMADRPKRTREDYERGLPGYHDPTSGIGGTTPALSALTFRIVLAAFGVVFAAGAAVWSFLIDLTLLGVVFALVALFALGNLAWVVHRKRRGEPG